MISEVDIRDWEHKISAARRSVNLLETENGPDVALTYLWSFIRNVEEVIQGQPKQVAALFKEKK